MRRFVPLFLLCSAAFAAQIFRVDPPPVMTTAGNAPVGGSPALYAVSNAAIQICTDTACSTPATTYTDATGGTACPSYAPVVTKGTNICTSTTDPQGNFGFWLAPGTYYYKIVTSGGQTFGNYPITSNTAGVITFKGRAGAVVPTTDDYTAAMVTNAVDSTSTYSNPAWITALASTKLTGLTADTFLQGTGTTPQAGALPNCTAAGCVYQYSTSTHLFGAHVLVGADIPAVDLSVIGSNGGVKNILPKANYTPPAWSDITGSKQGNTNVPQMAGTNSGSTGAALCNDANGNATTSSCTPPLPSGTQGQYLQITPNVGNNTTLRFNTLPVFSTADFVWAAQTPAQTLTAGSAATITLSPFPQGITAASVNVANVYITDGVTGNEGVLITGVNVGSTITVAGPIHNHTNGQWTIGPASGGLQECWVAAAGANGRCVVPAGGGVTVHKTVTAPAGSSTIDCLNSQGNGYGISRASDFANGDLIFQNTATATVHYTNCGINNDTVAAQSSGGAFHFSSAAGFNNLFNPAVMSNLWINGGYAGWLADGSPGIKATNANLYGSSHTAFGIQMIPDSGTTQGGGLMWSDSYIAGPTTGTGVYIGMVDGMWLSNTDIFGFGNGIQLQPANVAAAYISTVHILGVRLDGQSGYGIIVENPNNKSFGDVHIENSTLTNGVNGSSWGIDVFGTSASASGIQGLNINNNILWGWSGYCVGVGATLAGWGIDISHNKFISCNQGGGVPFVNLAGSAGVTLEGNSFLGSGYTWAIGTTVSAAAALILGNHFGTPGTAVFNNASGLTGSIVGANIGLNNGMTYTPLSSFAAPNGTLIYCTDCNSTCTAGASTGQSCVRVNGAWTH